MHVVEIWMQSMYGIQINLYNIYKTMIRSEACKLTRHVVEIWMQSMYGIQINLYNIYKTMIRSEIIQFSVVSM